MKLEGTRKWYWIACAYESAILLLGLILNFTLGTDAHALLKFDHRSILFGIIAVVPTFALFMFVMHKPIGPLAAIRRFMDGFVRPLFGEWSILQLLLISVLAGVGEEFLFRGVIQQGASAILGPIPAVIITSVIFGLCHFVSLWYAVLVTLMGVYFGLEFIVTDSLTAPILTHAIYDFAALVYFLRFTKPLPYKDL